MGVNYFNDEQVKELEKNPYVKKVSIKSITYSEEFKELFWIDLQNGMMPGNIFRKYGFDPRMLGPLRTNNFTYRVRKEAAREERFKDTRSTNSGRPSTKDAAQPGGICKFSEISILKDGKEKLCRSSETILLEAVFLEPQLFHRLCQ